ncbi:MAG: ribonuclease P protein component [Candidatus Omnitrophota bacterium]
MKIRHILRSKDFADIFSSGKKLKGKTVSLYSSRSASEEGISVGVVVSKAMAPLAVTRNYIKRLIYAFFREKDASLAKNFKVVVRLIRNVRGQSKRPLSKELREELERLTKKAGIQG